MSVVVPAVSLTPKTGLDTQKALGRPLLMGERVRVTPGLCTRMAHTSMGMSPPVFSQVHWHPFSCKCAELSPTPRREELAPRLSPGLCTALLLVMDDDVSQPRTALLDFGEIMCLPTPRAISPPGLWLPILTCPQSSGSHPHPAHVEVAMGSGLGGSPAAGVGDCDTILLLTSVVYLKFKLS